jgi:hypothetical protein
MSFYLETVVIAFRPFRRRLSRVFRPVFVLLLFKKPCDRARFRFFGWYVWDIVMILWSGFLLTTCTHIINI